MRAGLARKKRHQTRESEQRGPQTAFHSVTSLKKQSARYDGREWNKPISGSPRPGE